ncbi:hypothetical protein OEZ85_003547 [Tetradesmus obliquus]|uniref:Uncharacterized protein n=1 Tax=Tetradesmus obliquus TaxID=3088 RepID=A0ABY8UCR5_TETOB|nr:hypothetical protein OEZ85_003547 [Tetradesmus obliquus]
MLCEVLQREWAVLYYWSGEHGSHMSLIHRDRDYFALLWQSDPELAQLVDQLEALRPRRVHPYAAEIKRRSKELLRAAPKRQFSADETKRAGIAAMDGAAAQ